MIRMEHSKLMETVDNSNESFIIEDTMEESPKIKVRKNALNETEKDLETREDDTFLITGDSDEPIKYQTVELERIQHSPKSLTEKNVDSQSMSPLTSDFSEEDAQMPGKEKTLSDSYELDNALISKDDVSYEDEHDYNTKIGNEILEKVEFKQTRNCYCLLRCPKCKTCVHRFKGSLIDYSFPFHVCRHIQVVPHTYLGESVEVHGDCLKVMSTDADTGQKQEVNLPIISQSIKSKGKDFQTRKIDLTLKFLKLLNTIRDYKHFEYFERETNKLENINRLF